MELTDAREHLSQRDQMTFGHLKQILTTQPAMSGSPNCYQEENMGGFEPG